jgi:hypothetical protein
MINQGIYYRPTSKSDNLGVPGLKNPKNAEI